MVSGFRSVSFTLQTNDVLSTVMNILKSCNLPTDHMGQLKATTMTSKWPNESGMQFYRPVKWDKSFYTFSGFRDYKQESRQAERIEPTLRSV